MYRLGQVGTASLQDDLKRFWHRTRGKEDPFLKVGEANQRDISGGNYVYALQDINFEVQQGQVMGVIGKNGAGKSTLLKLLSKVTRPTTGSIQLGGRIASLLEVGTGFHPELTGRENIFLNGAILGMTKQEIRSKFDEIVDFSGCERYIDTPVKRYSSGMYVRLAFAVAAHLEPEILIVDEVLAVGDAEFQRKAIGKMKDVSQGQGRTVLFVSHNMASIMDLCDSALLLEHGRVKGIGATPEIVDMYLNTHDGEVGNDLSDVPRTGNGIIQFTSYQLKNEGGELCESILSGSDVTIELTYKQNERLPEDDPMYISIAIQDQLEKNIVHVSTNEGELLNSFDRSSNKGVIKCKIPTVNLSEGVYRLEFFISNKKQVFDRIDGIGELHIEAGNYFQNGRRKNGVKPVLYNRSEWTFE